MSQQAVRVSSDLVEAARLDAAVESRSVSGQIEHWAQIGRLILRSPDFDYSRVKRALRAELSVDDLSGREQAVYHEEFLEAMEIPSSEEEAFFADMRKRGVGVGMDEAGALVYGDNEPTRPDTSAPAPAE
ncbi:hypothetical protein [uncultured Algimonas sp.]|uniref:TA system antitoxin ParD family protein n=1 Tax=uncultured Algimonas sp. TaxID=1547920 RepID=UPI002635CD6A|nr:hypothetical protein [uncultured Algimonas sp.]